MDLKLRNYAAKHITGIDRDQRIKLDKQPLPKVVSRETKEPRPPKRLLNNYDVF